MALLDNEQQLIDEAFQKKIDDYLHDVVNWWKDYYKYSSNDERYLTATEQQIFSDYIDNKINIYLKEIGRGTEMERVIRGRALDPNFDRKENEAFQKMFTRVIKIEGEL